MEKCDSSCYLEEYSNLVYKWEMVFDTTVKMMFERCIHFLHHNDGKP